MICNSSRLSVSGRNDKQLHKLTGARAVTGLPYLPVFLFSQRFVWFQNGLGVVSDHVICSYLLPPLPGTLFPFVFFSFSTPSSN